MLQVISQILADWKRYTGLHKHVSPLLFLVILFRNPGMFFSIIYRFERYFLYHKFILFKIIGALLYPFYFIITYYILDIDIPPNTQIGKGLYVHNRGIIFTSFITSGENLTLIGPLTIGMKGLEEKGAGVPVLGNNVTIFTGARIIGDVKLGNFVYVGANAVVVKDVQSHSIVGGIPAKLLKKIKSQKNKTIKQST
jgi:serine O-acetyltransferase